MSSIAYQTFSDNLQGPLIVLQMLYNITRKDATLKDQNAALEDIKFLQNYTHNLNKNEMNKVNQVKAELEKCEDLEEIVSNENEDLKTCTFVMDAITRDDTEGCILRQLVMKNNIVAVEALLQQRVNINGNCNGSSILHAAAATNDEYLIQLVLDKGADVNKVDSDGLTPVQRAAIQGYDKAVYHLAGRSNPKPFGTSKNRLSHLAAKAGQVSVLKTLNSLFPKKMLQEKNGFKETPLIVAAANGQLNAVKVLIDMGANPNKEDKYGDTALHKASEGKHTDVVDYLLSQTSIGVNKPNSDGNTPLHLALQNGQEDIANKLMIYKADLWLEGQGGNSALHFAAYSNMEGFLRRLLGARVDVNKRNNFNETPLHLAAQADSREAAIALLQNRANVNAINNNSETPLHIATVNNAKKVVEELLKYGPDRNARDNSDNTPIDIARVYGNFEIAYILK